MDVSDIVYRFLDVALFKLDLRLQSNKSCKFDYRFKLWQVGNTRVAARNDGLRGFKILAQQSHPEGLEELRVIGENPRHTFRRGWVTPRSRPLLPLVVIAIREEWISIVINKPLI